MAYDDRCPYCSEQTLILWDCFQMGNVVKYTLRCRTCGYEEKCSYGITEAVAT